VQAKVVEAAERHFNISHVTWEYIRMMLVNYFGDPFNEHIWTTLFHELLPSRQAGILHEARQTVRVGPVI
jgi:hypothetical protein